MIYEEIIQELDRGPLNEQIKNGLSQKEIHKTIIHTFNQYFDNKNNLERYANDFLVHDWINYCKTYYNDIDDNINDVISLFRNAKLIDNMKVFEAFSNFQDTTVEIGNKYWSMVILQKDLSNLGDYEYVTECFKMIDDICEIVIKQFMFFLVYIHRISIGKNTSFEDVIKLNFGNLINELTQSNVLNNLLKFLKSNVSISQWRNIACHKSYQYKDGRIECKYGNNLEHSITFNCKEELLDITKNINRISQAINFAFKFFLYDNIQDIGFIYNRKTTNLENRNETWHLLFSTELYSSGFKVINIEDTKDELKIVLQEMTLQDKAKRAIQSSISIYKAWMLTCKDNIEIIYIDIDGAPYLSSCATSAICKEIGMGNKGIDYLAEKTIFRRLDK